MGLAYRTTTATPNGTKPIESLETGNPVLAGSPTGGGLNWTPMEVKFSSGTPDGRTPMVFLEFDGNNIVCTPNQPFLMPDGKIKRADQLVPSIDRLVNAEGKPVEIFMNFLSEFRGGVHSIATDITFDGSLDHHLLITAGVVTGDFCIEINIGKLSKYGLASADDAESTI